MPLWQVVLFLTSRLQETTEVILTRLPLTSTVFRYSLHTLQPRGPHYEGAFTTNSLNIFLKYQPNSKINTNYDNLVIMLPNHAVFCIALTIVSSAVL